MTEQAAPLPPPFVLGPPPPKHEGLPQRLEDWFHGHGSEVKALAADGITVADELKPFLQAHFARDFALVAKVLADPELKALAADVLELAESAARIGGVAL